MSGSGCASTSSYSPACASPRFSACDAATSRRTESRSSGLGTRAITKHRKHQERADRRGSDEILTQLNGWISKLAVHGPGDCVFPSANLVTPIWPESVLRDYVRPKLRPVELGWINSPFSGDRHSTLHKQRNSDLKIIADQQGHGMRTHRDKYVQSGVVERKAEAAKLYPDFNGVLHKQG